MKSEKTVLTEFLSFAAVAGNFLFILWMTFNGIKEHFRAATVYELISYVSLAMLLILNSILLIRSTK
jgi:hypothetical protein